MLNDANDGQGGLIQPSQESGQDPFAVFNEPIPLATEDDGIIGISNDNEEDLFSPAPTGTQTQQTTEPAPAAAAAENPNPTENENEFNFNDELVNEFGSKEKNAFDADTAIKELQKQGYNVQKFQPTDENQAEAAEYQRLENEYNNASLFMNKSDEDVILDKVRDDLTREYEAWGKQHLIGTQEFNEEVEDKIYKISENPTQKELYANNVRNSVQRYIDQVSEKISVFNEKREQKLKSEIAQGRKNIQEAIRGYMTDKFLGFDVTPEEAQSVYTEITSGEFTKQVNSNPKLVAEFALFIRNKEKLSQAFGGATYGEGVKAAVDAINKGSVSATKTSLQQAMTGSSNAQGTAVSRRQAWSLSNIEESGQSPQQAPVATQPRVVAGRGSY